MKGNPSKRALRIVHLLRDAPDWKVYFAFFTRTSWITLAGRRWTFERSIVVRDSGLFSQLGLSVEAPAHTRERLVMTLWPELRNAIHGAGFEMFSDFAETTEFAHFLRPLDIAEFAEEWRFINALRIVVNGKVAIVPRRAARPTSSLRGRPGVADRLFSTVRKNQQLMRHLNAIRITRTTRERIAKRFWTGTLALMGDRSWLQATIAFWPVPYRSTFSPDAMDLVLRIAAPLTRRGYDEHDPGLFSLCPLGPVGISRELSFLSTLRLSDLLAPGIAPPEGEGLRARDRAFYDILGPESADEPCKRPSCDRGAIEHSAMCRVHHFEMIKERVCPFDD